MVIILRVNMKINKNCLKKKNKTVENEKLRIFDRIDHLLTTNKNQSLLVVTSKIADKKTAWGKDCYEARIAYSYLYHNKPDDCGLLIRQRCIIKVNQVDLQHVITKSEDRKKVKLQEIV